MFCKDIAEGHSYRIFHPELFLFEVLGEPPTLKTIDDVSTAASELVGKLEGVETASPNERREMMSLLVNFSRKAAAHNEGYRRICWR